MQAVLRARPVLDVHLDRAGLTGDAPREQVRRAGPELVPIVVDA